MNENREENAVVATFVGPTEGVMNHYKIKFSEPTLAEYISFEYIGSDPEVKLQLTGVRFFVHGYDQGVYNVMSLKMM